MKKNDRASERVLNEASRNLACGDPQRVIRQLWDLENVHELLPELEPGDRVRVLLCDVLKQETQRLKKLLTENTRVRKSPFVQFTKQLGEVLLRTVRSGGYDLGDVGDIQDLYAGYRRNHGNFAPLRTSVRRKQNGWGTFFCCVAEQPSEFFVVASGHAEPVLVHFDQWLTDPDAERELVDKFAGQAEPFLSKDCCLVKVIKEFGPKGPVAIWDGVRRRLDYRGPIYRYDQVTGNGRLLLKGRRKHPKRFLVLYDLIKSGDGLKKVEDNLQSRFGARGVEVHHLILYDFSGGKALANNHPIYDSREHAALRPSRLAKTFAAAPAVFETADRAFERFALHDVDPVGAFRPDYQDDMQWLVQSEAVSREYEGRWVAVCRKRIIAAGDSYDEVVEKAENRQGAEMPIVHYVAPSPGEFGFG